MGATINMIIGSPNIYMYSNIYNRNDSFWCDFYYQIRNIFTTKLFILKKILYKKVLLTDTVLLNTTNNNGSDGIISLTER